MKNGLADRVQQAIPVDWLNDWERDELLDHLARYEPLLEKIVIEQLAQPRAAARLGQRHP